MSTFDLNRLVRQVSQDEAKRANPLTSGVVTVVSGGRAVVRPAGGSEMPGFVAPPFLNVLAGDHVLLHQDGPWKLILAVLNRNATVSTGGGGGGGDGGRADVPDSPGSAADYLARIKLEADAAYRAELGLDASDRPQLLMGDGSVVDLRAFRSGSKEVTVDDGAGGGVTLDVIGSLKQGGVPVATQLTNPGWRPVPLADLSISAPISALAGGASTESSTTDVDMKAGQVMSALPDGTVGVFGLVTVTNLTNTAMGPNIVIAHWDAGLIGLAPTHADVVERTAAKWNCLRQQATFGMTAPFEFVKTGGTNGKQLLYGLDTSGGVDLQVAIQVMGVWLEES